ncbi:hypothetical protein [Actinoplanes derwentensis]|uniref:Uncharacterized protein n=1 Tax=Actinoplanes derwentensis TaxID=113562 RepID=A0A1H2DEM7_9ACTN|nr:hypothetical protein [Actinoplanes derwentensis]GID84739.1 hypothetical protein Ade03nite_36630 [Actinoplanes derwentensis]SDT81205.1 hypothetical protein SAMN04489716_9538 [Actinoplanes derwentensis]
MPSEPGDNARRRLEQVGNYLLTAVGDWTAPAPPDRPGWSDSTMNLLVRVVTAVTAVVFLLAMFIIWLMR